MTRKTRITVILFYLCLIISWQMVFELKVIPPQLLPSPVMVFETLWNLAVHQHRLWPGLKATLSHVGIGFGLSVVLGLVVGMAMGTSTIVNQSLRSLLLGLQTLPTVAWVPISIILFRLSQSGIYFVIIMSSLPAVAISTADGIANIPPLYLRAAQTLGTPRWAMGWRVILPAALPSVVTGIKLGWTMGWHGAVSAELIKSTVGLGFLLGMGREFGDMSQVLGIMIITILLGLALDRFLFGAIERRIRMRWGLTRTH